MVTVITSKLLTCFVDFVEFVPPVAKTAQIYELLYVGKAIEFWQKGTSLVSTNIYK